MANKDIRFDSVTLFVFKSVSYKEYFIFTNVKPAIKAAMGKNAIGSH